MVNEWFGVSAQNQWIWVGLNDKAMEGQFVWSDDTTFVFPQWVTGQPDGGILENCAIYFFTVGKLYDVHCFAILPYICEFK